MWFVLSKYLMLAISVTELMSQLFIDNGTPEIPYAYVSFICLLKDLT